MPRLSMTGKQYVLTAESDVTTLWMTSSGQRIYSHEVRGKGVGVNDFDGAAAGSALHTANSDAVSAWHPVVPLSWGWPCQ
jgi:hypothetical protein